MKKLFSLLSLLLLCAAVMAQTASIKFEGLDANGYIKKLDQIEVINLTKSWHVTLYWPDTVLTIQNGNSIEDVVSEKGFALLQNNPNPFDGTTYATLQVAEAGSVSVEITDMAGRSIGVTNTLSLQPGTHQLRVTLATAGVYFLTAHQEGSTSTVKMVCRSGGGADAVAYAGMTENTLQQKSAPKGTIVRPFDIGDQMEYLGFAMFDGMTLASTPVVQVLFPLETVWLEFDEVQDGVPCPETPTVTDYDGNTYSTVRIGHQCWMKENLRTMHYANGDVIPMGNTNSSDDDPYYYDYNTSGISLIARGYIYNWSAVMHGSAPGSANPGGVQGICPNGWHLPSDAEWTQMETYLGGRSKYVCNGDSTYIAKALAAQTGWETGWGPCAIGEDLSTNNATGFTVVPAGCFWGSQCEDAGTKALFWTASEDNSLGAWCRYLISGSESVYRIHYDRSLGFSVRCVKN